MSKQKCSISDCENKSRARGYCPKHYKYFRYHEEIKTGKECMIANCNLTVDSNGLCRKHYRVTLQYKISSNELYDLLLSSNGICSICKNKCNTGQELSIDHSHITGKVRGTLCRKCNAAIGMFNDSPEIIMKAYSYIISYTQ